MLSSVSSNNSSTSNNESKIKNSLKSIHAAQPILENARRRKSQQHQSIVLPNGQKLNPLKMQTVQQNLSYEFDQKQEDAYQKTQIDKDTGMDLIMLKNNQPEAYYLIQSIQTILAEIEAEAKLPEKNNPKEPFNCNGIKETEQLLEQCQAIPKIQQRIKHLASYANEIECLNTANIHQTDSTKLADLMHFKYDRLQSIRGQLEQIYIMKKMEVNQIKLKTWDQTDYLSKKLTNRDLLKQQLQRLRKSQTIIDLTLQNFENQINQLDSGLLEAKYRVAILKMQQSLKTFYRYGGRNVEGVASPSDFVHGGFVKSKLLFDHLTFLDFQVYMIALMIPAAKYLFNNYENDSKIYRLFFNIPHKSSSTNIQSNCYLAQKIIQNYLQQQKIESYPQAVNNGRKKKIIIVSKADAFQFLIDDFMKEMKTFTSAMMVLDKIQLENQKKKFSTTCFEVRKLKVQYTFFGEHVLGTEFDVYHSTLEELTMNHLTELRKKTHSADSVFFWVDYPQNFKEEDYEDFRKLHKMLQVCKEDGFNWATNSAKNYAPMR